MYQIGKNLKVARHNENMLELEIDGKKAHVFTEDLAALVRQELPQDRAAELFSEVEEKIVSSGKVRVCIKAHTDIKKDDPVIFQFDITRYMDTINKSPLKKVGFTGVRTTNSGFIY